MRAVSLCVADGLLFHEVEDALRWLFGGGGGFVEVVVEGVAGCEWLLVFLSGCFAHYRLFNIS